MLASSKMLKNMELLIDALDFLKIPELHYIYRVLISFYISL